MSLSDISSELFVIPRGEEMNNQRQQKIPMKLEAVLLLEIEKKKKQK